MRLRDLESALSNVKLFENPIAQLEQYPTTPHLAAQIVHTMQSTFDDVSEKFVCDMGCGTGMLSIACAMMGATNVLALDVDASALQLAIENANQMDVEEAVDFLQVDVTSEQFWSKAPPRRPFDTVVMNPPFGTKRKGVDMAFLQVAAQLSRGSVYSLHKTSTREFIAKKANSWGAHGKVLAELRFDIGRMYRFHRSDSVDVEVDLWRFDVSAVPDDYQFPALILPTADDVHLPSKSHHSAANRKKPVHQSKASSSRRGGRNPRKR